MIGRKCSKKYDLGNPDVEGGKIVGPRKDCGMELKFKNLPKDFAGGAVLLFFSTPFFFVVVLNWHLLLLSILAVSVAVIVVWLLVKYVGGYVSIDSIETNKKPNRIHSFLGWTAGFMFSMVWSFFIIDVFR